MYPISHALSLLPQQCRLINATEGVRLEVCSGCLWLTRPGDAVDRFLVAGSTIDLHENHVLIQSDRHPGAAGGVAARYVLVPLCVPSVNRHRQWFQRLTRQAGNYVQGLAEVSTRVTLKSARGVHGLR
ncbi:MAG: DUF2917 domain-containing protein [Rhodoferax sp.]|uniref:DUF2917 domain-containing protein n=1 Tax=Rhodoferax sp. TaxID=50421 RepID=UPI002732617B|nr:DUF2917 domain-containing protein [Rhodoferax sp.]MDP2680728.1 DUF2917 domain-containing protein [Rhodoferax sp.]